jgi:hypothetical protein
MHRISTYMPTQRVSGVGHHFPTGRCPYYASPQGALDLGLGELVDRLDGRSTHHPATAEVAREPEDQQNDQHKTEQSAAVVWPTPTCTPAVIRAAATEEQQQYENEQDD